MPYKVLFITLDQMRGDALSALGHPCARTPALDQLAADGVLFRRHFGQATPCGPARASLLTSLYPMTHRSVRNGTPLDARHTNLAEEVRRLGIVPTLVGYTDTTLAPRNGPSGDPALRTYENMLPGFKIGCHTTEDNQPWRAHLQARDYLIPDGSLGPYRPIDGGAGFAGPETHAPRPLYTAADSDTAFLTDKVLEWLGPRKMSDWFLHLAYLRPHPPFLAPEPWRSAIDPVAVPDPMRPLTLEQERALHPFHKWLHARQTRTLTGHDVAFTGLGASDIRQVKATYFALLTEVDHHIGRILDHLRATGEDAETLIVVTADHGELLGDRGLFGKEGYLDGAFHVPLIVRDPRTAAAPARGSRIPRGIDVYTEAVDLMPTLLDWLGGDPPAHCDGRSLRPFLGGRTPTGWRTHARFEFDFRDPETQEAEQMLNLASDACTLSVLRGARYKYVHFTALPPLLFDLAADPEEMQDLAGDPGHAGVVRDCAQALLSQRLAHADRTLTNTLLSARGPVSVPGRRGARTGA